MSARLQELRNRLRSAQSVESPGDLKILEETIAAIFQEGFASQCFPDLFGVFERFPDKDAFGGFWSILHGLEAEQGYQPWLLQSVDRAPSIFTLQMVNRLINSGVLRIGSRELIQVLEDTAQRPDIPAAVREEAVGYVNYQKQKTREPGTTANVGPPASLDNPGAVDGPPSVSSVN